MRCSSILSSGEQCPFAARGEHGKCGKHDPARIAAWQAKLARNRAARRAAAPVTSRPTPPCSKPKRTKRLPIDLHCLACNVHDKSIDLVCQRCSYEALRSFGHVTMEHLSGPLRILRVGGEVVGLGLLTTGSNSSRTQRDELVVSLTDVFVFRWIRSFASVHHRG